ncbi:hypothetical protein DWB61_00835 [Ancylomarina euxinus]|uniref:DUF5689 domain-containing protein n=1 Tax=Ancylomarina euxinus TaxID=2283627 RepID=A0A425Y7Y9_9BACT|nr:DUF5689 domain-containing protein [Ancylomarina euxinus]MCZ4693542.1 DUF5689 domain-containing protein [Ancylomarina euxinus]MUP13769.1 hypothetical protein [Ancylomarina euxinus]RRG24593.1 hypothetical protein DWB61_00835 [Ancylomarina euxinus]
MRKALYLLFLLTASFSACDSGSDSIKETIDPIPVVPVELVSNTTISDLKDLIGSEGFLSITQDLVIEGKVISDDYEKNIYESIVINDTKANADFSGIEILLASEELGRSFKLGQKILVKCKGLILGDNVLGANTLVENGKKTVTAIERNSIFDFIVKADDILSVESKLTAISNINDDMILSLIKVNAVQFIDADLEKNFGDANADVIRTLTDKDKNTLSLNIRKTADFGDTKIPAGNGSVMGILTKVNGTYELVIRGLSDVVLDGQRVDGDDNGGSQSGNDHENFLTPEVDVNGKIIVKYTPKDYVSQISEGQHMMSVRIPDNYYTSASTLSGAQLRSQIQSIISSGVKKLPYTSSSTDVWDMCEAGDQNPDNASQVWQIYKEQGISKSAHVSGSTGWNREHVWAKSHGDFGTSAGPGTDGHHLRASDAKENGNRAALDFANVNGPRTKNATFYEPPLSAKGDVARSIFYMAVRYGFTVDELGGQGKAERHGKLADLLKWNELDPVDPYEIRRNNVIYGIQNNRNPFIDHPELVKYIFGDKKTAVWKN